MAVLFLYPPVVLAETALNRSTPEPARNVQSGGGLEHTVANLQRAIKFYRDVLGLPVDDERTTPDPAVMRYMDSVGGSLHYAMVRFPGGQLQTLELAELRNISRKAAAFSIDQPGAAQIVLEVNDLNGLSARLRSADIKVRYTGHDLAADGRLIETVLVQDPDGFFIRLEQVESRKAVGGQNFVSARLAATVADLTKTTNVYGKVLGYSFSAERDPEYRIALGRQVRSITAVIPGSSIPIDFLEFKDGIHKENRMRLRDPGASLLHYFVRDIDRLVTDLKVAGAVVTPKGGIPVLDSGNDRVIVLLDPNSFFIDLHEKQQP